MDLMPTANGELLSRGYLETCVSLVTPYERV